MIRGKAIKTEEENQEKVRQYKQGSLKVVLGENLKYLKMAGSKKEASF